jgi:Ni,Fe-hydrogenase III small subunit
MYTILKQIARTGIVTEPAPRPDVSLRQVEQRLSEAVLRHFGRALAIRHVDAGSCNGCELEIHACNSPHYNLERLGIRFVASPRHADLLLVTGPVSRNMETALRRTYDATPEPKLVVAIAVDVAVPGCPPEPLAIIRGILAAVELDSRTAR